ncbi:Endoplasmic reticulum metallopeptidase 1 [Fibrella aestuarina BUZ 2]|uniref:Vacuolar membrane protease n=1 Tax=Fibrella aestuarina BUZ 2 TaxID=1166018 RepID=I0K8U3_9BACT|nr:M20/M25/M40 family metallo-hydrolase [Fibrella aestuarina]CCH00546.1 Endoplasmic reticulum metallopeptidase 1 [Fibrella aestuarina BUZ 2]
MLRSAPAALLSIGLLIGLSVWFIRAMQPPAPLPATAPSGEFSAQRAFTHVRAIGNEPHAMGTPAHIQVRSYLLNALRQLNLNPQVQETTVAHRSGNKVGYVFNVMARLKGRQSSGKAVLMLAHYDSQPNARGAADDASSVAAILETARALQTGPPPERDVIFLLTDGEEYGLFGAQAFVRHPWAKDVGFVMNLEARGVRGPSLTFEISPQNGWAVEAFGKAAPYPLASSLMYEVYSSLPNNTDFTVFRLAGYTGLNSAYIDGFVHYHKLTDSPENLDLGTLQHHGSNLLALTRYLASQPLEQTKAPDKVFFNTVGFHFVQYPMTLNGWLVALLTLALLGTLIVGLRKRVLTIGQSLAGAGAVLLIILLITGLFWPITVGVRQLLPPAYYFRNGLDGRPLLFSYYINGIYGSDRFLVAYALLATGLFGLLTRLFLRWIRPFSLVMGVYWLVYALVLFTFVRVPSATFQLLFPLLFSTVGTWVVLRWDLHQRTQRQLVVGLVAALPTLLLIPLVRLLFVTFDLQMPIIVAMVLFLLTLSLLLPVLLPIDQPLRWRNGPTVALGTLGLGLLLTGWAIYAERPSAEQPLHSMVSYYLDADSGRAYWSSQSPAMDHWKKQFFPKSTQGLFTDFYPASPRQRLTNGAPVLPLPAPTATVVSDSSTATGRHVRLRIKSVRGAAGFEIGLISADSNAVQTMSINGEPARFSRSPLLGSPAYQFFTGCNGLPLNRELTLTITAKPGVPLQLLLYDETMTLPASLVRVPLPPDVVFEQGQGSNQTVVRKLVTLGRGGFVTRQ